jgi:tetratricopeptide (TPR) repeat protein
MSQSSDSFIRRNPYIIGRPITEPERFFGRNSLFEFITDNLLQGSQVILLHGQRRIGKSSVLAQIPHFVDLNDFVFVALSLEGDSRKSIGMVLHELARDSLEQFDCLENRIHVPSSEEFKHDPQLFITSFLPDLRQALGARNIVLLLDEFDALGDSTLDVDDAAGHLFPFLQQGVYDSPHLYIIPVVGRQLDDLPTMLSLFREAPSEEVGLLDRRSAERLITVPAKGVLDYESDAIDAILELSAGHPYFTQVLCFAVFANAREENRWTVTRSDVKLSVDRAIDLGGGGLGWFWEGIPLPERVVFAAAAEVPRARHLEYPGIPSSLDFVEIEPLELLRECGVQLTDCLRDSMFHLVEWKFLRPTGTRLGQRRVSMPPTISTYQMTIELVRRWLLKHHPIRDAIWELEELDPEAHKLYEAAKAARLSGTTPAIVARLSEVLKINPNHFSALFELAKSYADLQQFPQALKTYKRAHLVNPVLAQDAYVQVLYDYGEELNRQGEYEKAIEQLEEALDIEPDNSDVAELLQQVRKVKEYDRHLKVIPITASVSGTLDTPEVSTEEVDMSALRQNFTRLWNQVETNAPEAVRNRALEHLNDLQEEIFAQKAVDGLTLLYVYRWFSNHLPEPLVQAVTEFVDHVTALIGRQRDLKKRDDRSAS